ncbi:phosphoadenosine phosphosulfate reductase family protein [Anaeroselena agilis]|uniref:Phosphoadenosine phosphosulfate reductase family protein n=1 Tax=Anaeroselena agilis TaxID=3063788 RepID=A0ABU3NYJ2_9FIRM|nr:phosphoadenosine phosphosulfate reductase family protein [Selenomonadales bacterium 4137-cl]
MYQKQDLFTGKFSDPVADTIRILQENEPPEGYYLAYSGGKDSIALKWCADQAGVKYDAHYKITTVDPPELIYHMREYAPDVSQDRGEWSMWNLILHKKMPPTRNARYCCSCQKESSSGGRILLTGIRWAESPKRAKRAIIENDIRAHIANEKKSRLIINPIAPWADADVWGLIRQKRLPYPALYDQGFKRLGCVLCPLVSNAHRQMEEKRWPKIAAMYRWTFNKLYEIYGREHFALSRTWKSGDAIYEWYMGRLKLSPEQQYYLDLFEMENFGDEDDTFYEAG